VRLIRVSKRFKDLLMPGKIAEYLLEKGLNSRAVMDGAGNTALHFATNMDDVVVAKVLIEAVPAGAGRDEFIMTQNDPEGPSSPDTAVTALHRAAIEGNVKIAEILIQAVSNGNRAKFIAIKDKAGDTALDAARACGQKDVEKLLLKY
jgi:ankyrin repeat protein